ncbi:MAG: lamin tail domain-containing protein [Sedimentisphaerales bacterium]|nr:lamin tail domain-containing protein [Sedimentisphaerales bacterium]
MINEIHVNPDVKTEPLEFVELYNSGEQAVDLSGWYFSDGISYRFPPGSTLPPGGYVIVAQEPAEIYDKWGNTRRSAINSRLLFGPYEGKLNNEGEEIELRNGQGTEIDRVDYGLGFPWPTVGDAVPDNGSYPGTGHSMQLVNPGLDNDLAGSWRSGYPTAGMRNLDVYADNIPPHIRQVRHWPQQPQSGDVMTISAKVTDPNGVTDVTLQIQIVAPGQYVRLTDPEYSLDWTAIPMHDDGLDGDLQAGDQIYTARLPGAMQVHRRLMRYRITASDGSGLSLRVPYPDDPQPNFAYFVYDGVPAWRGAVKPGDPGPLGEVVEFGTDVMRSLPAYHLISRESDVLDCQYNSAYRNSGYRFAGTLVYDGQVYDHIHYRIRGQNSTYVSGKNKWKLRFNRGHFFQGRDDYGSRYATPIKTLNLSGLSSPWAPQNRGMAGMDEAVAFRLFNMVGVPAPHTAWFQLRIIDTPQEADRGNQYEGDLWGLYLAFENPNNQFLDEHDLPDGNVYKMQGAHYSLNQGPTQPTDKSDLASFISAGNGYNKANPIQPLSWWRRHVNLDAYYSYRAVVEVINHSDLREQENCVYYHHPESDQWWMLPWDVDLLYEEFARWGPDGIQSHSTLEQFRKVLQHPEAMVAFQDRGRELQDLLFNQDQLWHLIDELAAVVADPNLPYSMADVDRTMWDYNPRTRDRGGSAPGVFYRTPYPGADIYPGFSGYARVLTSADFAGMVRYIKDFVVPPGYGGAQFNELLLDPDVPARPTVTYVGAEGYPTGDLVFLTDVQADPPGDGSFAALQWRIAEVEAYARVVPGIEPPDAPAGGNGAALVAAQSPDWRYVTGDAGEPSDPVDAWRRRDYNDRAWRSGQTSIGYGDNDDSTVLDDMPGNYSTVYLRHTFTVPDMNEIGALTLKVYVDDGCIAWINGTEVARVNVSAGFRAYNDVSGAPAVGDAAWQEFTLDDPHAYLREGANVLAVQALNAALSSSDLSIDVSLIAEQEADNEPPDSPSIDTWVYPVERGKRGRYEIDALWESEEITDPTASAVVIPADVVRPGRTYRVRCRMKDTTGHWSRWSQPFQFVAGDGGLQGAAAGLRVTELMYNPQDPPDGGDNDDYEFIELKNTGDRTLDLTGVCFADGIVFDFGSGAVTLLNPGQHVLVVGNRAAFESRYGRSLSALIAGEYEGRFANGGERVLLLDPWEGTIAEFAYDDGADWPRAADGSGHSLVPLESALPEQPRGSLNHAGNWRASAEKGGSPGTDDPAGAGE